ncbi:hypothetical protein [Sandaracinus amylolyticus]|uniref:Glycosyltransferase RgtA/B/C/D-like domain-containing protein n=1 Tax=Sandaracinus amylolyticus TaxID=927083 RepID=A0A0F6SEY4_9BACT|nr:hypothetical protein [Sandaracinus amylolyticus]AKF05999.1 hypothetical protein DB32_003148 [Sandaracinus amylolyticus]
MVSRRTPPPPPSHARTWAAIAICAAVYLYAFPYQPEVNNPNENVRFFMTAAIVDEGTYAIDAIRARWGWVNDAALYEGHVYSVKAPGTSLMGVPGYWLYRRWCDLREAPLDRTTALWVVRMTASALPMLVFLFFFHRWLARRGAPPVVRDGVFLSVALGSLLLAYATMFVSHATSAAAAFGAFMLLERARHAQRISFGGAWLAGLLAAMCTALEYPGFVATAVLCVYALICVRPWHRLVPFALGAILPTLAVLHFHWRAFGDPLTPGHRYLEHAAFRELANEGFFGASEFSSDAAGGLLFDLGYGLFPLTPVLLLAFFGFPRLLARRRTRIDAIVALAIPLGTWGLICFMNNWRGGWTVGPRYLALALPFVAWGALEGGAWMARSLPRVTGALVVGATGAAFLASGGPSIYYPHLPEAFTRPVPQLVRWLVRHDFAPYNAGSWIAQQLGDELWGTRSMVPLFVLALLALVWIAWAQRRLTDRLLVLIGASFFGSTFLAPIVADDPNATGAPDALAYVVRFWEPEGHDVAARLEQRTESGDATPEDWARLVRTYEEEGRRSEARSAERRARSAAGLGASR